MNYAKYKELSKALSIRAFGVSESENAVFLMEKRRIRGEKTPFSPSENAVFLFKNAVFSRKNGVFQPGSSILCEKVPFSVFRTAKCVLNSAERSVLLSCFAVKVWGLRCVNFVKQMMQTAFFVI